MGYITHIYIYICKLSETNERVKRMNENGSNTKQGKQELKREREEEGDLDLTLTKIAAIIDTDYLQSFRLKSISIDRLIDIDN